MLKRRIVVSILMVKMKAEDNGRALFEGTKGDTVVGSWTETGQYFDGLIDEVRLLHRALTEKEIAESMELILWRLILKAN